MKKPLFIILALCCLALTAAAKERTIIVTGSGSVRIEPDTANVQLGVESLGQTAQLAQAENAKTMRLIMAALEKSGLAKKNIMTSNFNIWPEMKYEQNQPPKLVGYHCSNQVNLTIGDLNLVSKAIDAGIGAGANNVRGLSFSRQDDREPKKLALTKAVEEAAGKAAAIAKAAGLKLSGAETIVESGADVRPQPLNQMKAMALDAGSATPVSPGEIEVRGSVTVTYGAE